MKNAITNRLHTITSLITDEEVVCDVGTDHGYTAIYIAKDQKNNTKKIYASDVNEKPLSVAHDNIRSFGVEHKVETFLSDGLNFINENKFHIDTCILSGLGGNTIIEILANDSDLIDCYIISANNNSQKIREWVKQKKYFIEDEKIIEENEIFYEIIKVNKYAGAKVKSKYDVMFGPCLLKNINREFVSNWARIEEKQRNLYQTLLNNDVKKSKEVKKKLKMINKVISKEILKYV